MSRAATTKLFFDEELNSQLLEGGELVSKKSLSGSSVRKQKKGDKAKGQEMQDGERGDVNGFIGKTFGLFSVMIAFQLVYVLLIAKEGVKDKGGVREFAAGMPSLILGIVLAFISTAVMVCKKSSGSPIPVGLGYVMWLLFTVGMTFIMGTIAARKSATIILAAEISTMVTTLFCTFFGGRLLKATGGAKKASKLGPTVAILSLVLATVVITCMALGIGGLAKPLILSIVMVLFFGFFILDIHLITKGNYGTFQTDDYVLASMKLFADFILIFSIIMSLFNN